MGLDIILYRNTHNYQKVYFAEFQKFYVLDDLFFAITKDIVLFKTYFQSLIFSKRNAAVLRFEIANNIKQFLPS